MFIENIGCNLRTTELESTAATSLLTYGREMEREGGRRSNKENMGVRWKAATTKRGPNDVRRVVWAVSKCFLLFSSYFYILTMFYSMYKMYIYIICDRKRGERLRRRN